MCASALVERQRVVAAGAVAPRRHPAGVRQRLQVPADRRLRQLQHRAELRHRQLVPLEDEQHAAARRVRERRQVVEDGGVGTSFYPYIRMETYIEIGQCQPLCALTPCSVANSISQLSIYRRAWDLEGSDTP